MVECDVQQRNDDNADIGQMIAPTDVGDGLGHARHAGSNGAGRGAWGQTVGRCDLILRSVDRQFSDF